MQERLRQLGGNNTCLVDRRTKKGYKYIEWVVGIKMEENSIAAQEANKIWCVDHKEYIDCVLKYTMIGIYYSLIHIWKVVE